MAKIVRTAVLRVLVAASVSADAARAQQADSIRGEVVDADGVPMPYVNVLVDGTTDGASTARDGRFSFSTRNLGRQEIRASMIGFESNRRVFDLVPGDSVVVTFVMPETLVTLDEAVVTADSYTTGEEEAVTLQSLEVVTTPGAAADIFLAIKTFPGVSMVDEGAGLFVRGGDVGETVILLD